LNSENSNRLRTIQESSQTERDAESFNSFNSQTSNFHFESEDVSSEKKDAIIMEIKTILQKLHCQNHDFIELTKYYNIVKIY